MADWQASLRLGGQPTEYREFLSGKRVVVVGPAETLIGLKSGACLDTFDVVVRLNNVHTRLPFPAHLSQDIGARFTVLYICPADLMRLQEVDIRALATSGVRYVITWSYRSGELYNPADPGEHFSRPQLVERIALLFQESAIAPVVMKSVFFEAVWDLVDANPKCGFLTIMHLLSFLVAELRVTGMTFMHGGGHLFRKYKIITPTLNHKGEPTTSNPASELNVFRQIFYSKEFNLTVDETLSGVMQSNH